VEVGVRFGYGRYAGLPSERLMGDEYFPVCSRRLLKGRKRFTRRDLQRHSLLHDDSPQAWRQWLRATGTSDVDPERGHVFNDASLMLEAAAEGLGLAMARHSLVQRDLATGRLLRPFSAAIPTEQAYFLVTAPGAAELPRVQRFIAWLKGEAAS
jgi:LysR family glycine cleavage system transcriptional activator